MLNFSKVVIFICVVMMLPLILNIIDNSVKIFNMFISKNSICDKIVLLSKREFLDFVVEFFSRRYGYELVFKGEDVYIKGELNDVWVYCENDSCNTLCEDDARKILALCECRGISNVFIFTTRNLSEDTIEFFKDISREYSIRYIHKKDLEVTYAEFVYKFYSL